METLSQATLRLQKAGYTSEISPEEIPQLNPDDWVIDEIVRFEGDSNPDDSSILYALSTRDGKRKSLLIDAYGMYENDEKGDFIVELEFKPRQNGTGL